ncbi:MAG: fibrobacter succinogenes major paralogous domain-containing protein [Bacteroidales bacterium]|nr:fibrobacter succinogenes major paralogous domain-containing protein [Bacteroidales bacterium]
MKSKPPFENSLVITCLLFITLCIITSCEKEEGNEHIADIDGNKYSIITIGSQVWLGENLKVTRYNDGTAIPLVTDDNTWGTLSTPAYCWYDNDEASHKNIYGALYNWYAVETGKLCPDGWHVPTDSEWKQLEMYLGMSQIDADNTGFRGTGEGGKLKEAGTAHWGDPNEGATNESSFTAMPGGFRKETGVFDRNGYLGVWWSATESDASTAWYRRLNYCSCDVDRSNLDKRNGRSVRCIRD